MNHIPIVIGIVAGIIVAGAGVAGCRCRARVINWVLGSSPAAPSRLTSDRGQATTEYALILLAAALIGLLVVAWTTAGGAAGRIGELFDRVVDSVISRL